MPYSQTSRTPDAANRGLNLPRPNPDDKPISSDNGVVWAGARCVMRDPAYILTRMTGDLRHGRRARGYFDLHDLAEHGWSAEQIDRYGMFALVAAMGLAS